MGKQGECMKARDVLWYLTFFGFAINYMMRININITIVDMVDQTYRKSSNKNATVKSECFDSEISIVARSVNQSELLVDNQKMISMERKLMDALEIDYDKNGFKWNEHDQNLLLGSYFWLHWVTQIPGGILATKYGTKKIFGLANLVGCLLCSFMPLASYLSFRVLLLLRILQGLVCGLAWPAMHNMTALWIPKNERSKFVTAYLGSSVGVAVFFPIFGFIIQEFNWEYVYHFGCLIGIIWYICWYFLVFDSPLVHPRIDPKEKDFILQSIGSTVQMSQEKSKKVKRKIPWKHILTSKCVWMIGAAQLGGVWGLFTIMTQAPTFFRYIHGWGVEMTGLLSGIPHLGRFIFALIISFMSDYLLRNNKMSRTNVRKMNTFICCILSGAMIICLALSGCNSLAAIIFMFLATALHGSVSSGPLATMVDISPNYASITMGLTNTIICTPGFLSPIIVSSLTLGNQTIQQWKIVFLITGVIPLAGGVLFVLFSDSTVQEWNAFGLESEKDEEVYLKKNVDEKVTGTEMEQERQIEQHS